MNPTHHQIDPDESFESAIPVPLESIRRGLTPLADPPDAPPDSRVVQFSSSAPQPPPIHLARALPSNLDAEESVIACCLIDDGVTLAAASATHKLRPIDFYDPRNALIFETLLAMQASGVPIATDTLASELTTRGNLERAGGFPHITQVSAKNPTTAQAAYFAKKVKEQATLREIIRAATAAVEDCYAYAGSDLRPLTDDLTRRLTFAIEDTSGKAKTPYTVWQPEAFRAFEPPPDLNFIGAGYIRRRQLTTLIGPPGVGKSRLSLWLAVSHITGRNFFDLDAANGPAKWLFFGNENDPLRQKTDLGYFYNHLTAPEQKLVDQYLYLHVLDKPDDGIITLADAEAYAKLTATLKSVQPDVIVFDPWANMIEGNENDNEEVRKTLKLLLKAVTSCCPNAAILVIHHARTGKSTAIEAGNNFSGGSLGRGSKALVSSARCELALWPGHSEDSSRLVLTCEKVNNVKKFEPKGLLFEHGIYVPDHNFDLDSWRDDIAGTRSSGKTLTIEDLVDAVRNGVFRKKDIVDYCENNCGVGRATVTRRLKDAVDKGWLKQSQPPGSYSLGDKAIKPPRRNMPYNDD